MARETNAERTYVRWFEALDANAVAEVGGKNGVPGGDIQKLRGAGIAVPDGFATTAAAYREVLDEDDEAVTTLIRRAIEAALSRGRKVGLCGQAPSDRPEFARFLVEAGIDSLSVSPDTFLRVKRHVAAAEGAGAPARERG